MSVNATLKTEQQQHAKDVEMYESYIEELKMFCNDYFEKLVNEHDANLKISFPNVFDLNVYQFIFPLQLQNIMFCPVWYCNLIR